MPADFGHAGTVHYQPGDLSEQWSKAPGIAIDVREPSGRWWALTPNVVRLTDAFRMYYTESGSGLDYRASRGQIMSAFSADGATWEQENGVRLAPHSPYATLRVVCPDVIPLPGGGVRMYVAGQSPDDPSYVVSAVSDDGLNFEPDPGVRFGDDEGPYGPPRCVYLPSEGLAQRRRLYFYCYTYPLVPGLESANHIVSATSDDGLDFKIEPGVRIRQETELEASSAYAPEVLLFGDG